MNNEFDKAIEKQINKRIRTIAVKAAVAVVAAALLIFLGISPLMNLLNKGFADSAKADEGEKSLLCNVLGAYYETTHPYMEVAGVEVESKGFGSYYASVNLLDAREPAIVFVNGASMEHDTGGDMLKLSRSTAAAGSVILEYGFNREFTVVNDPMGRSVNVLIAVNGELSESVEEIKAEIEKLPDSAYMYMTIEAQEAVGVDELLASSGDDLTFQWLQVYQPACEFQGGMDLQNATGNPREEMTAAELKQIYIDNLNLLIDNKKLWNGLALYSGFTVFSSDTQVLKDAVADMKKNDDFKTKNYCLSGTKAAVLSYLSEHDAAFICLDKVKVSRYEQ